MRTLVTTLAFACVAFGQLLLGKKRRGVGEEGSTFGRRQRAVRQSLSQARVLIVDPVITHTAKRVGIQAEERSLLGCLTAQLATERCGCECDGAAWTMAL